MTHIPTDTRRDIRDLRTEDLVAVLHQLGHPAYRARQIEDWLWRKGVHHFEEMTNLPKDLRAQLYEIFTLRPAQLDVLQKSADGTIKLRLRLHDGHLIESVIIPVFEDHRYTVCVSTQAGCSLSCTFCATGKLPMKRNLTAGEIIDQVKLANQICQAEYDHPLTNIVYMGMGEPFLNYRQVMRSLRWLTDQRGFSFAPRRITVSTVGLPKMIRRFADEPYRAKLAVSLHAPDDAKRSKIMPINQHNNIRSLLEALDYYYRRTRKEVSFEYIAFSGFNLGEEDAKRLIKICRRFPSKVNIIEYNPIDGAPFQRASESELQQFAIYLLQHGVRVTVRKSRGRDIDAACGQLANKDQTLTA